MPTTGDAAALRVGPLDAEAPRASAASHYTDGPARASVMLLRLLRAAQPISRAELARRVGVNRSTVTDTFKPLVAGGVVTEESVQTPANGVVRSQGRPASALSFNDGYGYFLGVGVGVRRSTVGLATLTGEVLAEEEFETPAEPAEALALMRAAAEGLCRRAGGGRRLRVIGVSAPGPSDAARRRIAYAPHFGWRDVDVAGVLLFDADGKPF